MARRICVPLGLLLLITCAGALGQTAGSSSKKTSKPEQKLTKPRAPASGEGSPVYQDREFDFRYKVPFAWVDRTKEMQDQTSDPSTSKLLLAVFERPPEVSGDTINSAVIITAENASSYPGLKSAADFVGPLTELTTSKGFKPSDDAYEFPVGATRLVRADFAKAFGNLTMYQSSLISLKKGFVISFTFIAGSENEMDELMEKLSFGAAVSQ